jgi:hypothetical protein
MRRCLYIVPLLMLVACSNQSPPSNSATVRTNPEPVEPAQPALFHVGGAEAFDTAGIDAVVLPIDLERVECDSGHAGRTLSE